MPATPAAIPVERPPEQRGMHVPEGVVEEEVDFSSLSLDEQELARMGYKQELNRSWSGFSNFAISFSIISILAGCFTTFYAGWNGGGPAAIAWGWPILAALVLCIGLCLSELVSAFPTSGGIYWWASKLGGVKAGYYTGWLNLIGLLAIVASVAYGCATFFDLTLGFLAPGSYTSGNLDTIFLYFLAILAIAAVINIFSSHLLSIFNNISVWWHVLGAAAIVLILIFLPDHHASAKMVFTSTVNNTGFFGGKTNGWGFIFIVLPLGALLTQYTITGMTPRPTCRRRPTRPPTRPPRASGAPSSTRPSAAGSCCSPSSSPFRTRPASPRAAAVWRRSSPRPSPPSGAARCC